MVLILNGNSEIGTHVRSNLLIFDMFQAFHYIESSHKTGLFHGYATCFE